MEHKRQMNYKSADQKEVSPEEAALRTIGMRIRKVVAEGYSSPSAQKYSMNNGAFNDRRIALPSHMDQPPSLMGPGSTMDSCSNMSDWASGSSLSSHHFEPQLVTLPETGSSKRKHENGDEGYSRFRENADYMRKYGGLSFDEEF